MNALLTCLDSPKSSLTDLERDNILTAYTENIILRDITHVIDIEAYAFKGYVSYREVSIINLKDMTWEKIQCYDETPTQKLTTDFEKTIRFQYTLHGLPFCREKEEATFMTQEQLFEHMKTTYSVAPRTLFAYKGGDFERRLCRRLDMSSVNLEHFGVEKYDILLEMFELRSATCRYHYIPRVHCSLYEVFTFAMRIFMKLNDHKKFDRMTQEYCFLQI